MLCELTKQSLILLLRKLNYLESTDRINLGSSFRWNDFEMRSIVQSMDPENKLFLTDRRQCGDCVTLKIYFSHAILVNTESFKWNTFFFWCFGANQKNLLNRNVSVPWLVRRKIWLLLMKTCFFKVIFCSTSPLNL